MPYLARHTAGCWSLTWLRLTASMRAAWASCWACGSGLVLTRSLFKLMNAGNKVEQVLELTRLDRVFESCSVRDLFCLLRRAAAMPPWSVDESNPADAEANCNPSVLGQESVPAC